MRTVREGSGGDGAQDAHPTLAHKLVLRVAMSAHRSTVVDRNGPGEGPGLTLSRHLAPPLLYHRGSIDIAVGREKRRGRRHPGMVGNSGTRQIRRLKILGAKSLIPGVIRPEEAFFLNRFRVRQRKNPAAWCLVRPSTRPCRTKEFPASQPPAARNPRRNFHGLATGGEILHQKLFAQLVAN